jgi:hypothetical protein
MSRNIRLTRRDALDLQNQTNDQTEFELSFLATISR